MSNSIDDQNCSCVSSSKVMLLTMLQLVSHVWNRCQLITGDNFWSSDMTHVSVYSQCLSVSKTVLLRHCCHLTFLLIETAGSCVSHWISHLCACMVYALNSVALTLNISGGAMALCCNYINCSTELLWSHPFEVSVASFGTGSLENGGC